MSITTVVISSRVSARLPALVLLLAAACSGTVSAATEKSSFNLGMRLESMNWVVTDNNSQAAGTQQTNARGELVGFTWQWYRNSFYLGGGLAGGTYTFQGTGYRRYDGNSALNGDGDTVVERGEFDIVAGYYFWRSVSMFVNLKAIGNTWDDDYKTNYYGLGAGVTYNVAFSEKWHMFGSAGVLPTTINQKDGNHESNIGRGLGGALEVGALMAVRNGNIFTLGLKSQRQRNSFDNDMKQVQVTNGVQFRYFHSF